MRRLDGAAFESLTPDDQLDWLLLRNHLRREKAALAREKAQLAEIDALLPFRSVIQKLEASRQQRAPQRR